jgi:hypothetical protein
VRGARACFVCRAEKVPQEVSWQALFDEQLVFPYEMRVGAEDAQNTCKRCKRADVEYIVIIQLFSSYLDPFSGANLKNIAGVVNRAQSKSFDNAPSFK